MVSDSKCPVWGRNLGIISIALGILLFAIPVLAPDTRIVEADFVKENSLPLEKDGLVMIEENSLIPISENINNFEEENTQRVKVILTAYSSTPGETDSDPYITASGTFVRTGIVANNWLPLNTKIKIPELYGDKVFVVEDRMSWKKSDYHIDIWFPSYWEALNFGAKTSYIEIVEN